MQRNEPARSKYRQKAEASLSMQVGHDIDQVEAALHSELADAAALQEQIATDETRWIAQGIDVDEAFIEKYRHPTEVPIGLAYHFPGGVNWLFGAVSIVLGIALLFVTAKRWHEIAPDASPR